MLVRPLPSKSPVDHTASTSVSYVPEASTATRSPELNSPSRSASPIQLLIQILHPDLDVAVVDPIVGIQVVCRGIGAGRPTAS